MTEGEKLIRVLKWLCDGHEVESDSGCIYKITDQGLCVRVFLEDDWITSSRSIEGMSSLKLLHNHPEPEQPKRQVRSVDLSEEGIDRKT